MAMASIWMGVMMATHAQWATTQAPLRELEASMVQVQSEEIAQMARWYQQWYGPGSQVRQAQPG